MTKCQINIQEVDGKLMITANIPDNAEKTIAGVLTKALIDASAGIMNTVLGESKQPEKILSQ